MYYHRTALATQIVDALQGKNPFGDAPNGLFLAAPRRTGKSTFLQLDLKPALERQKCAVVYVDFWAHVRRDPGEVLADALAKALLSHRGVVSKLVARSGLAKLTVPGLEFDLRKIGQKDGISIPEALQALQEAVGGPLALLLDEAQHALSSEAGEAAMMALKSARDQMNRPGVVRLMLVLSGSDRDKLLRLVNTGSAPFFGSQITRMPMLGPDFIEHIAVLIDRQKPDREPIDRSALLEAFQAFGYRPQFFLDAIDRALSPLAGATQRLDVEVLQSAREHERNEQAQMQSDYFGLRPIERAVLWRMLEQGPLFRPYDGESSAFYAKVMGRRITKARIQNALESLRNRAPPLVWKSARGEYAVEDTAMHAWFNRLREVHAWPPDEPLSDAPSSGATD